MKRQVSRGLAALLTMVTALVGVPASSASSTDVSPPTTCGRAALLSANPHAGLSGESPQPYPDGRYTAVLLVHGWHGRSSMWWQQIDHSTLPQQPSQTGSLGEKLQRMTGAAVYTLDYHDVANVWFTGPGHGGALYEEAARCLARSPAFTGHRMVVVAHSMGGLIVRWAMNVDSELRDATSLVVTLGSPYAGSWLSAVGYALSTAGAAAQQIAAKSDRRLALLIGFTHLMVIECTHQPRIEGCAQLDSFLDTAGTALQFRAGSAAMKALADWPAGGPTVEELAGQILLENAPSDLFGGLPLPGTLDLGDGVVGTLSAGDGRAPTRTATCRYTGSRLRADWHGLLGVVRLKAAVDQRQYMPLVSALWSAAGICGHVSEARLVNLTNEVLGAVHDELQRQGATSSTPSPLPPTPSTTPPSNTSTLAIGATFDSDCVVAWPTAPVRTSDAIIMTMSCAGVPEDRYLFTQVQYGDPNLPVTPDHPNVHVHGRIVDVATSEYGYRELVVVADKVQVLGG